MKITKRQAQIARFTEGLCLLGMLIIGLMADTYATIWLAIVAGLLVLPCYLASVIDKCYEDDEWEKKYEKEYYIYGNKKDI